MSDLSPETRKLLDRARTGDRLPPGRRARLESRFFARVASGALAGLVARDAWGGSALMSGWFGPVAKGVAGIVRSERVATWPCALRDPTRPPRERSRRRASRRPRPNRSHPPRRTSLRHRRARPHSTSNRDAPRRTWATCATPLGAPVRSLLRNVEHPLAPPPLRAPALCRSLLPRRSRPLPWQQPRQRPLRRPHPR